MDRDPSPGRDPARTRNLLARYLEGDRAAERELFEEHRAFLVERARAEKRVRALHGEHTEEDLVDECFLRVFRSGLLEKFEHRGPGSLRSLLVSILDKVIVDVARRGRAVKRGGRSGPAVSLESHGDDPNRPIRAVSPASTDTTPSVAARADELLSLCREVLTPPDWEVWRLTHVDGLDSNEVGARSGLTSGAVRSRLRRIRARLVREIAARGGAGGPESP